MKGTKKRSKHSQTQKQRETKGSAVHSLLSKPSCSECGSDTNIRWDGDEQYCQTCGAIIEGPEKLAKESTDRQLWYHEESSFGELDLGGDIEESLDSHPISDRQKSNSKRLRLWQKQVEIRGKNQTIDRARREINRISSAVGLGSDAKERANAIYYQARKKGIQYRRSVETVAGASVYLAIRLMSSPHSIESIETVVQVDRYRLIRAGKEIKRALDLEIKPRTPECYLPKFASDLNLSMETQQRAREWIKHAPDSVLSRHPASVAAAALYKSAFETLDEQVTQQTVAENTPISRSQLSTLSKELQKPE